jgi:hypothetical protein
MNRSLLRRTLVLLGAAALLPFGASAAIAQDATTEATGSTATAEATALQVGDLVVIGQTSGKTAEGEGQATATAIAIFGETVSGGEQSEAGTNEGELIGTGETPLGEVSIAPYSATVEEDGSTSSSAALARVVLIDEDTVYVRVLGSDSETSAAGSSRGHSDGAQVRLGGDQLDAHVLHAEASSDGESDSAVAVINDNGIITDEQTGGVFCPLDISPLLIADIVCAAADAATGEAGAGVAEGSLGDGALPLGAATTDVTGGTAADDDADDESDVADDAPPPAGDDAPAPAPADDSGALPTTGLSALGLLGVALGSIGSGAALRRRGRR